jgi:hypothetical protein
VIHFSADAGLILLLVLLAASLVGQTDCRGPDIQDLRSHEELDLFLRTVTETDRYPGLFNRPRTDYKSSGICTVNFSLTAASAEKPLKSSDNKTSCLVWE